MELRQIKYFLAVVDFGTFLAAAKHVHVSQPALSESIQKLESSLNVKLFERGSRAAKLTPEGQLFLAQARQSYEQLVAVKSKLSANQVKLNIGVLNTIPMDHVTDIIHAFKTKSPHVFIELVVDSNETLFQMIKSKNIDLAFTTIGYQSENFTLLFEEHLKLVVSAKHPFSEYSNIEFDWLSDQPFIERINCESWDAVHRECVKHNIRFKNVCRAESDESVISLVSANLGISIMPDRNTPYDVKFITIKGLHISRPIGLFIPSKSGKPELQEIYQTAVNHKKV